jgi:K+/H+ antiporter YhaU regulatory subunit KhtT
MLNPAVVDFFETALRRGSEKLNIEDLAVGLDSPALGKTLEQLDVRRGTGVSVLAVLREGTPAPSPETLPLAAGDQLLALGTEDQLARLEGLVSAGRSPHA